MSQGMAEEAGAAALAGRMLPRPGLRVVVTGGGAGIGRAIAEGFVAAGAFVRVSDVDAAAAAGFSEGGGGAGEATAAATAATSDAFSNRPRRSHVVGDASDARAVADLIEGAMADFGGLDVVVANAGIAGPTAPVDDIAPEAWDETLAVDLRGVYLAARHGAPALRRSQGLFLALSSVAGRLGFANRTPYAAAKWGVVGFVKSLALELGPEGGRANAILPGIVEGPRIERVIAARAERLGQDIETQRAETLSRVAMRRMVSAEEIAGTCLYLASPLGAAITGQAISVCAGVEML